MVLILISLALNLTLKSVQEPCNMLAKKLTTIFKIYAKFKCRISTKHNGFDVS